MVFGAGKEDDDEHADSRKGDQLLWPLGCVQSQPQDKANQGDSCQHPFHPKLQAGVFKGLETSRQFFTKEPFQKAVNQDQKHQTSEDEQGQCPVEIQDASCQEVGSISQTQQAQ